MTRYYGVIGSRDHIKYKGEKRPFWEFLDIQPDGFLSSLAYLPLPFGLPDTPKIGDCGAWSYKSHLLSQGLPVLKQVDIEDVLAKFPEFESAFIDAAALETLGIKTKKMFVTPKNVLRNYSLYFNPGDLVIAPDHMLISGLSDNELNDRRAFNIESARQFLPLALEAGFKPMATVHGMDLEERLINIGRLYEMGYKHFSLGGMAARASQKKMLLESIQAISDKVRSLLPDAWIHVLGLSSPDYFSAFNQMGIDSCDGSSHFKQAFTAGTFYTFNGQKLVKHQAARPTLGEQATAPLCACLACSKMRQDGIDTRTYGSNENNMGRAAHNLNMLMLAQKSATRSTQGITLVSCVGKKATESVPAKNLYQSPWFLKAKRYVESQNANWFVISAKYGLIHRDAVTEPYEQTLNEMSADDRRQWSLKVFDQILEVLPNGGKITIYAGQHYREYLIPQLINAGYQIEIPLEGLGIGQQLAWFDSKVSLIQLELL